MTPEEIKHYLNEVLDSRDSLDRQTHTNDHIFIASLVEASKRRRDTMDKIKAQIGGWAIISFLSGIGFAVWALVQSLTDKSGAS